MLKNAIAFCLALVTHFFSASDLETKRILVVLFWFNLMTLKDLIWLGDVFQVKLLFFFFSLSYLNSATQAKTQAKMEDSIWRWWQKDAYGFSTAFKTLW